MATDFPTMERTDNDQPHAPVKDYFRKLASEGRRNQQTIIDPEAGAKQSAFITMD